MIAPDVLVFADAEVRGSYAVTEPSAPTVVASVAVAYWSEASFKAEDAAGRPLCSGSKRRLITRYWDAVSPSGQTLAALRLVRNGDTRARLHDGQVLMIHGASDGEDWSLVDGTGVAVLSARAEPARPDAWVVRCHDARLDLAAVVGIVEVHRLMVRTYRGDAGKRLDWFRWIPA